MFKQIHKHGHFAFDALPPSQQFSVMFGHFPHLPVLVQAVQSSG